MTASKIWAFIAALIVVGGGIVGTVAWRQSQPDAPRIGIYPTERKPHESGSLPASTLALTKPKDSVEDAAKDTTKTADGKPEADKVEASKPVPSRAEPPNGKGAPPHFDVIRVEPSGDALLAGKGEPNAKVALVEGEKVVAETKADASGHFVMMPPPLKPGDYNLALRQTPESGTQRETKDSTESVAVSVPRKGEGQVVVALAEPGKPTKMLSATPAGDDLKKTPPPLAGSPPAGASQTTPAAKPDTVPSATAPATGNVPVRENVGNGNAAKENAAKNDVPKQAALAKPETQVVPPPALQASGPKLAIRSVELENGNGFFATGTAPAGTFVQIYLNNAHIADVTADTKGEWTLTVRKGLTGGHYTVRADASGGDRSVIARVEVPFDVPVAMAETASAKPVTSPVATPAPRASTSANAPEPYHAPNPSEVPGVREELPESKPVASAPAATASPSISSADAPAPPSAPAPSEVAGLGPEPKDASPAPAAAPEPAVPSRQAEPTQPADPRPVQVPGGAASNAVVETVETATVVRGDNLWNISRSRLGQGYRYTQIYAGNSSQIRDPNLIYPGQIFVMPRQ